MKKAATGVLLMLALLVNACSIGDLTEGAELPVEVPQIPSIPGLPTVLRELPGVLEQLGVSDLGDIPGLPDLDALPALDAPLGAVVFRGPVEVRIDPGAAIPGTDIRLVTIGEQGAEFSIDGLRSERQMADSLDFDGQWPSAPQTTYNLRLRIYRVADDHVRAAGVHQLIVQGANPVQSDSAPDGTLLRFAHVDQAATGEAIAGTTLVYVGVDDRGAQLAGLATDEYPFRKVADSIGWSGLVRADIHADYSLRMLSYDENNARIGGIVSVTLPNP